MNLVTMAALARIPNRIPNRNICASVPKDFPAPIVKWWTTFALRLLAFTAALVPLQPPS